jgi:hypothetical protein
MGAGGDGRRVNGGIVLIEKYNSFEIMEYF